jgi:hypothetical protein
MAETRVSYNLKEFIRERKGAEFEAAKMVITLSLGRVVRKNLQIMFSTVQNSPNKARALAPPRYPMYSRERRKAAIRTDIVPDRAAYVTPSSASRLFSTGSFSDHSVGKNYFRTRGIDT